MCFYVFSPDGQLNVSYVSESIKLSYFQKPEIFVDICIENTSTTPRSIKTFRIIYPNIFKRVQKTFVFRLTGKVFHKTGEYSNHSDTLSDGTDKTNQSYQIAGIKIGSTAAGDVYIETNKKRYEGIPGLGALSALDNLADRSKIILNKIGFEIFEIKLNEALQHKKSVIFRLKFCPKYNSAYRVPKIRGFLHWLIDKLYIDYHIHGPVNVLENFRDRLDLYRQHKKEHEACIKEIEKKTSDLINGNGSTVDFSNWSVHVIPSRLRMLTNVYTTGLVETNLGLPSYLISLKFNELPPTPSWSKRIYDWYVANANQKFGIYFSAKAHNRTLNSLTALLIIYAIIYALFVLVNQIFDLSEFKFFYIIEYITSFDKLIKLIVENPWASLTISTIILIIKYAPKWYGNYKITKKLKI